MERRKEVEGNIKVKIQAERFIIIKYLIYIFLICVGIVYIFSFKDKFALDAVLDESDDFFYFYEHTVILLNLSILLGIIMYWVYGCYNKMSILKTYKVMGICCLFASVFLIFYCGYLSLGALNSCGTNRMYISYVCWYLISLIASAVMLGCSLGILMLSVKEMELINKGIVDRYTSEDDFPKKSTALKIFCILNILLMLVLLIDNLQLFNIIFPNRQEVMSYDLEMIFFLAVPVFMVMLFINRLIMREKTVAATVSYLELVFAVNNFWYGTLAWDVRWDRKLFIIALWIVIGAYIAYNLVKKYSNDEKREK